MAPVIETERLVLRPWAASDREAWVAMCADERVMETLGGTQGREKSLADADRLAAKLIANGFGWWVVEVAHEIPFAGLIALQDVNFEAPFTPAFEVGWRFVHAAWGRGFATEGARAAIDFAFSSLGKSDLVAITAEINRPSQRVMERLGMDRDPSGDFDHPRVAPGHPLKKHVLYRIAKSDWLARKAEARV